MRLIGDAPDRMPHGAEQPVMPGDGAREADRFREIFRRAHALHLACAEDEWLAMPCCEPDGSPCLRPLVWSRRNGPWRHVDVLWVGAAPGNAGGRGSGTLGAHGTRIPFGGDIAGANLEVLMGSAGVNRNQTFIVAALNQLPQRGGGEPRPAEILAPIGLYEDGLALLRDAVIACRPRLIIALGNVALRALAGAVRRGLSVRLPGLAGLQRRGLHRHGWLRLDTALDPDPAFRETWVHESGASDWPALLWTLHPSAQNMSPFAGEQTAFHARLLETRRAVRTAVTEALGQALPDERPELPRDGIYALPEWESLIAPRLAPLLDRWRDRGV